MKYTRFKDIPQFTPDGSWECDFGPFEMLRFIDDHIANYGLNVDPDFQRAHVWSDDQRSAYIEFFLRGGKTGRVIYINHPGWQSIKEGKMELVDGKQRIEAWRKFRDNQIKVCGSFYNEFTDTPRRIRTTLKININTLQTRAEVLQWYLDFNSGGVVHSVEEIEKVKKLLESELKK